MPSSRLIALRFSSAFALALAAALPVAAPAPARASLVLALDTPGMVQRANHIVVADVVSVNAAWDDAHQRILTTVDLAVVETWKGTMTPASHVKIVQPGGTVGDMTMVVFGMSRFSAGERTLVFLEGTPDAARVVGMAQGKRAVRRETSTGRWMVHVPERSGASFLRTPQQAGTPLPVFENHARTLEDLRAEVRDIVSKATGR
jgi:hypothetical protein